MHHSLPYHPQGLCIQGFLTLTVRGAADATIVFSSCLPTAHITTPVCCSRINCALMQTILQMHVHGPLAPTELIRLSSEHAQRPMRTAVQRAQLLGAAIGQRRGGQQRQARQAGKRSSDQRLPGWASSAARHSGATRASGRSDACLDHAC